MSNDNTKIKKTFLIATLVLVLILPFIYTKLLFFLLFIAFYYIIIILFFNQKLAIFLLILLRPCLDYLTKESLFTIEKISINFAALFGAFALLFALILSIKNLKKVKQLPLLIPWILFLSITFINIFTSFDFLISSKEWIRLLSIFSLYILGYLIIKTKKDLVSLVKIIILSTLVPSLFALFQCYTQTGMSIPFEGIYNRIYGTFTHPNLFAYYLIMPIFLSITVLITENKKSISNLLLSIYLLFLFYLLILTYTRGAWLAFIISILIITLIRSRILSVLIVIIFFSSYTIINPINTRINDLIRNDPYGSIQWRIDLWEDSLKYSKQNFIIGYGTGTANELILKNRGEKFGSTDSHNDYLKILLENGIIGLFLYLNLIIALIKNLFTKYKLLLKPKIKIFILVIFSISISIYSMSAVDNIIRNTALQWSFWIIIGGVMASIKPITKK